MSTSASSTPNRPRSLRSQFVWLAKRAYTHVQSKPTTSAGLGMDSDFMVYKVLPLWNVVEECRPDRPGAAGCHQDPFQWVNEACADKAASVLGNERIRFNHQTFPALGCLYAGQYFQRYYDAAEAKRWLDIADACFKMQQKAFKAMRTAMATSG